MQPYDIAMLVVIVVATVFGASKGVAWQVTSLASLVASYFVAMRFSDVLAPYLSTQAPWNKFLAMLVLYLATSLAIWIVFRAVSRFIDRLKLREFDRQIGALMGAAKGMVWCVAITFFAVTLSADARAAVLRSRSGQCIATLIKRAKPIMPRELNEAVGPYLDQLKEQLESAPPPPAPPASPPSKPAK
ncbi:MAG TPA: CvpA family protein [Pirellulales bacterium]|jgi:membrane protein required for colicin V production|nr:CvpA family protein [Pirellulales bacterium]